MRKHDIPDRFYYKRSNAHDYHYDDPVFDCVKKDAELLCGYRILQGFYSYHQKTNYDEVLKFLDFIIIRIKDSEISELVIVSKTFSKWKYGIATSIARSQNKIHYSNSTAENINTHIEMLIGVSYGCRNFERFRKRVLLIRG